MAEDRTLATARAADMADDEDATKAELQRRMEQARETITQTVTEIKDTVTNQYQSVRETISDSLDWREQFRKRPVAWSVGALSVGFVTGYCIASTLKSDSRGDDYPSYEETDVWNVGTPMTAAPARSYAAQAIVGGAHGSTEYTQAEPASESRDNYSSLSTSGSDAAAAKEPSGPSLLERFKETKAFDRLQDEVSKLGDRFVDQLSTVGQEVVLPALIGKIKEMFGVDLSTQKAGQERGRAQTPAADAAAASPAASADRRQATAVSDMGGMSTERDKRAHGGSL